MSQKAHCACGAVQLEITGDPFMMAYCHCNDCRGWIGAPVHGAALWPMDQVKIAQGADNLITYKRSEESHRKSCATCGSAVFVEHPSLGMYDVLAGALEGVPFKPTMHVHYASRIIDMADDLPKFADMPAEFGGSGEEVTA